MEHPPVASIDGRLWDGLWDSSSVIRKYLIGCAKAP
jgi:hypothetical protein